MFVVCKNKRFVELVVCFVGRVTMEFLSVTPINGCTTGALPPAICSNSVATKPFPQTVVSHEPQNEQFYCFSIVFYPSELFNERYIHTKIFFVCKHFTYVSVTARRFL